MNSFLPNCRFITIPSESLGRDWYEKSQELDEWIQREGMDLAQESVYLLFSKEPSDILEGDGSCRIARSVIGPKKNLEAPLKLTDWVAGPVFRMELSGNTWEEMLEAAEDLRLKALQDTQLSSSFMVCFERRLDKGLMMKKEILFNQ